ncbi:tagaturonate reductase [Paenibacillus sp. WLX1005]|uniref:tagaturonate reductase n=1 Tax=Paenibacillus sp. WLX1005 TaxID=3243766 RepID=UPI003983E746
MQEESNVNRLNRQFHPAPRYPEKVIQFGEGNFLRAFADWHIQRMNQHADFQAGVVIVQPLPNGMAEALNEQDGLYTIYTEGMQDGELVQQQDVMDCVTRGINPYTQYEQYEQLAQQPELRYIISNTTEAGIAFDPADTLEDMPQRSYPGKLTALLYRRYTHFQGDPSKGFIILPCELIDRNGDELKRIVLQYAELWQLEAGFIQWLEQDNVFCCSLVDRIVPGYPKARMPEITQELGYEDHFVVVSEPFHLWVIEAPASLAAEWPAAAAGLNVKIVDDMTPYRTRKVRILNGAHTAMTPVSYLYGLYTVSEAVGNEVTGAFVRDLIHQEIIPTLDLPEEELQSFAVAVLERFANPYVQHQLMSISLNGISKFKTRDLPTLLTFIEQQGHLPRRLTFALAALFVFYRGQRNGQHIALNDDAQVLSRFAQWWTAYDDHNISIQQLAEQALSETTFWEQNLHAIDGLTERVAADMQSMLEKGMGTALQQMMQEPSELRRPSQSTI